MQNESFTYYLTNLGICANTQKSFVKLHPCHLILEFLEVNVIRI